MPAGENAQRTRRCAFLLDAPSRHPPGKNAIFTRDGYNKPPVKARPSLFRRYIALPQDHGSWVFLLSPLLIGLFAGGRFIPASLALVVAVFAAFLLRQPLTIAIKVYAGRRSRNDLPAARFWIVTYGSVACLAAAALATLGFAFVLWLAVPGAPIFAWHLWLVSRRAERRQAGVEILATGVLALAAPAALWVGAGTYDPQGWILWILVWLQSAASIIYAYLRLEQRTWKSTPNRYARFLAGWQAYVFTSLNFLMTVLLGPRVEFLPPWIFVPYLLQWLETLWGIDHPATGAKPTAIGLRQLVVSSLFTLLFILFWR